MALPLNHLTFFTSKSSHHKLPNSPAKPLAVRAATSNGSISGRELVEQGIVRPVTAKEVASAIGREGYVLLDVRPAWECDKARVGDSLHVPFFVEDTQMDPLTLLKKWVHFGYIGLWTGQRFTTINPEFMAWVDRLVPDREAKLLVACGEGLRSLMAVKRLHDGGYRNLGWLAGGYNRAKETDFPGGVKGPTKLQYATIGGVSYFFLQLLLLLRAVDTENN